MALASLFGAWRAERGRRERAQDYVAAIMAEPSDDANRLLASFGDGDDDHARWELRYARRTIGLLIAERDALDDQTSSDVAAALVAAHDTDTRIAPDKRGIAAEQFNVRLREYRAALADRSTRTPTADRLAEVLLRFAAVGAARIPEARSACAEIVAAMVSECNAALRGIYGEASLPEDIKPSELA